MKKFLTVLLMITCIFGLTACGVKKENMSYDQAEVESLCTMLYQNVCMENAEEVANQLNDMDETEVASVEAMFKQYGIKIKGDVLASALSSYAATESEVGKLTEVKSFSYTADAKSLVVVMLVDGELHDAEIEYVFDEKLNATSVTVNALYSFGEKMQKAALNTLMGMGTVFMVLILICLIISLFTFIPKIQEAFSKKDKAEGSKAVAPVVTPQIVESEELSDDTELVAVIAAAIAASEGAVSTDGFVVRSIRRANRR